MNVRASLICLISLLACAGFAKAEITELNFSGQPLTINLPVDEFVTLYLPDADWAIGVPAIIAQSLESHSTGRAIELRARVAFQETLVPLKDLDSDQQMVIRLSANRKHAHSDYRIRDVYAEKSETLAGKPVDITKHLTRYASLSLYAPLRLQPEDRRVRFHELKSDTFISYTRDDSGACIRSGLVKASPVATWSSGHYYVTAVRVENTSDQPIVLDGKGCHVPGDWLTSTWQHTYLEPARACAEDEENPCRPHFREVTTLYLTSKAPFWTAVAPLIKAEVQDGAAE